MEDPETKAIFDALFQELLVQEARPWRPPAADKFWLAAWRAADVSRACRKQAAQWSDAGILDWAIELEDAANALDAE